MINYTIIDVIKDALTFKLRFATKEVASSRYQICVKCEVRDEVINTCTACGCFLPAKVKLQKSNCPLGNW